MSNVFLKSDLNDIFDTITESNLSLPNWINIVDVANKTNKSTKISHSNHSVTSSAAVNQAGGGYSATSASNLKTSSAFVGQLGGGYSATSTNTNSTRDVNKLISMLTSESSTNFNGMSETSTITLENQLRDILKQDGGKNKKLDQRGGTGTGEYKYSGFGGGTGTDEYKYSGFGGGTGTGEYKYSGFRGGSGGTEYYGFGGATGGTSRTGENNYSRFRGGSGGSGGPGGTEYYGFGGGNGGDKDISVNDVKMFFNNFKVNNKNVNVKINDQNMSEFFNTNNVNNQLDNTTTDINSIIGGSETNETSTVDDKQLNNVQYSETSLSEQNGGGKQKKSNKEINGGKPPNAGFQAFLDLKKHIAQKLEISNGPGAAKVAGKVQSDMKEKFAGADAVTIAAEGRKHFDKNVDHYKKFIPPAKVKAGKK
jgi:hypothetical protein